MSNPDQGIDHYIENAADFAKPILKHLRKLVHIACPEIIETIKWGMPFFEYKGLVCCMASFKHHCAFVFWKGSVLADPAHIFQKKPDKKGMGQLGKLSCLADLPEDAILIDYIQRAIALNEAGVKVIKKPKAKLIIPNDFAQALAEHPLAQTSFDQFSYSHKKEYLIWIIQAKTAETRQKRIKTSIEWLNEGKSKNWKYFNKK